MPSEPTNTETLEVIADLQRVQLQPGDVIVATTELALPAGARDGLSNYLNKQFAGHRVVLLCGAPIKFSVWNEAQEPALVTMAREIARLHDRFDDLIDKLVEEEPKIETDLDGNAMPPERDQSKAL